MTNSHRKEAVLSGQLLDAVRAFTIMRKIILSLRDTEIWIISAYLKREAIEKLLDGLDRTNRVKILVRWKANDILSGASDIESYEYAAANDWLFYTRQDIHAKAYRLGLDSIFVGSPNLTNLGFSLIPDAGNAELIVKVKSSAENLVELNSLFDHAVLINDKLFSEIKSYLVDHSKEDISFDEISEWPLTKIEKSLPLGDYSRLLVSECLFSNGSWISKGKLTAENTPPAITHDLSLLGITSRPLSQDLSGIDISGALGRTKVFRWLQNVLYQRPEREMYFGNASALLHDALLDDPRPYRSEVKELLSNLISWIKLFPACGLIVDHPHHSERIRIY